MRLEQGGGIRWARIVLIAVATLGLLLPFVLWYLHGRQLAVDVVLLADAYLVAPAERVPLHARTPQSLVVDQFVWSGPHVAGTAESGLFQAPQAPGLYTVAVTARRSAGMVEDRVSIEVLPQRPDAYPLVRPIPAPVFPGEWPVCPTAPASGSRVTIAGKACPGANVVAMLPKLPRGIEAWHGWQGNPSWPGRMVNLRLPWDGPQPTVVSTLVNRKETCRWTILTKAPAAECAEEERGSRRHRLFADFSWQFIGPGHFSFFVKPQRTSRSRAQRYLWQFGDGTERATQSLRIQHQYQSSRRYWLVTLVVVSGERRVSAQQVVVDRSVIR